MKVTQAINPLSFDEALFLIGCTLCQRGFDTEGMSVIVMYALGNGTAQYQDDIKIAVLKERDQYLRSLPKKNILWEIIDDKWDNPSITKYKDNSGRLFSLKELASGAFHTKDELYSACLANNLNVSGKDLMLLFFNVNITYEYMRKKICKATQSRLSDDTVQAAYQDFVNYYTVRSLRSYKAETGNPLGALAYTFNDFYIKSSSDPTKPEANFFNIINSVGIMAEDEDGLRPNLDTVKVAPLIAGKGLDFQDVVEKIYKVSALLYQINAHNGSFIYNDLFSRYRDLANKDLIKNMRLNLRSICDFYDFELEDSIEYRDSIDSISQYSADRKAVSAKLIELVSNDIPDQQMFDYYKDLEFTDLKYGKNGSKGFANLTFSKSARLKLGMTYDEQIKVAIEGALALKKLVQYARAHNINLNKIDNRIFRDKSLHNKCKTLEDYILLQKDLKNLVEVASDDTGADFMSNDSVMEHLTDLKTIESATAASTNSKEKVNYAKKLEFFKRLNYIHFDENVAMNVAIMKLNEAIGKILNSEYEHGYLRLCYLVNYINCNLIIGKFGGCQFYDVNSDRISDNRIIEFTSELFSKIEGLQKLHDLNLAAKDKLCQEFNISDERILLAVGSLSETFLGKITNYVEESSPFYADYIMSLLDMKYALWMNITIDTFDTLYYELLDCSRQYYYNYTLDKEIAYKNELKSVFSTLMEECDLIHKSKMYAQRKLIAIPSKELIIANQTILMQCNTSLSALAKNQLKNMFSFNSVNFAYQNGILLEYNQCYVHRNGYLFNKVTKAYKEITLDDLVLLRKMAR